MKFSTHNRKHFGIALFILSCISGLAYLICHQCTEKSDLNLLNPLRMEKFDIQMVVRQTGVSEPQELNPLKIGSSENLNSTFVQRNCQHILDTRYWVKTPWETKICVFPKSRDKWVSGSIISSGNWEMHIQRYIFREVFALHPDAAFVDIGANLGVYSLSAALLGRPVFAFEPSQEILQYFSTTISLNNLTSDIAVYPIALMSEKTCAKTVAGESFNQGHTYVVKTKCNNSNTEKTATLDDLIPTFWRKNITSAIMKIDVEGAEPDVIFGGKKFLQEIDVPIIAMEFMILAKQLSQPNETAKTNKVDKMVNFLTHFGYNVFSIGDLSNIQKLSISDIQKWPKDVVWVKEKKISQ